MNKKAIDTIATYSGTRASAISGFIRKHQLNAEKLAADIVKNKTLRKDLSSALSGYSDNELATTIVQKYKIVENRRADDFFSYKHGKAIFNLLNQNGKVFNREVVKQYLDELNSSDILWARMVDFISSDLGLNPSNYNTYNEQEADMIDAIEKLYREYSPSNNNTIVTKKAINEMLDRTVQINSNQEVVNRAIKRVVINIDQFEALINVLINKNIKPIEKQEALEDKYIFEVYVGKMKMFIDFVNTLPNLNVSNIKKDGSSLYITVSNSGRFIEWVPLVTFYKERIKL